MVDVSRAFLSDLTDAQWALIELLLPAPNTGGRPEKHPRRDIVDAILYVVPTGCAWRQLPFDFPPWQTVYWNFTCWPDYLIPAVSPQLRRRLRPGRIHMKRAPANEASCRTRRRALRRRSRN